MQGLFLNIKQCTENNILINSELSPSVQTFQQLMGMTKDILPLGTTTQFLDERPCDYRAHCVT